MAEYLTLNTEFNSYMIAPRFLLDCDLMETAKMVYIVLLDRARLSISNGWEDEYGHVYIYFTIANLAKVMHKGETTIKNCLKALEKYGLIVKKRQGLGRPNRIYVKLGSPIAENPIAENPIAENPITENPATGNPTAGNPT